MAQVVVTEIETNGLSAMGLQVLKAALKHAHANASVKCHELPLDDFCALAGLRKLSGEAMRLLLREGQRVLGCIEVVDIREQGDAELPFGSSPMFNYVDANDSSVAFEVPDFVLHEAVLNKVLALVLPRR
jgi:hypothetical protein